MIRSAVARDPQAAANAFGELIGQPVRVYRATRDLSEHGAVITRDLLATSAEGVTSPADLRG